MLDKTIAPVMPTYTISCYIFCHLVQYVNVTFVTGSYVSTGVNVKMLIEQNDEKITYSASEQLRVTFEVPPGYTNLSKAYPQEAVIVRQSTMINISGEIL